MPAHTAKRLWNEETGCGFCMRSETGSLWCRGLCRDVSLAELVRRVRAVRDNAARLELSSMLATRRVPLHAVPDDADAPSARAVQRRSVAVERMVRSLHRLRRSAGAVALSADRLEATRTALAATRDGLAALPLSPGRPDRL
ncbi:hypothetical protein [Azospirillum isscasi]|uniref:Uncharacterized protein n=1 Tax=Azospirillum isscasi TaxID=3053926 RepID=A0ABU0WH44_9PROT|nr:hypothetical protein [Azospirillum isscasi]MDQ2103480.1 hypothetical protein [Azospirillum isscasi]